MLEQADSEKVIIRNYMRDGIPLPNAIQNAPQLWLGLQLYWNAFWDLTTCRSTGLSVAPIPWLAMKDYALTNGFDDEQYEAMMYLVRAMDNAYMDFRAREAKNS